LPQIDHEDILIFVLEKEEARYKDLIKAFVDAGKCSKQTFLNYKLSLEASGRLRKKLSQETGRPVYFIPEEAKSEVEALLERRRFNTKIDKMTPKEIKNLMKMLDAARSLLIRRKISDAMDKGQEYITLRELLQTYDEIKREAARPKIGNLFGKRDKAWSRFLKKQGLTSKTFNQLKNWERIDKIRKEFEEYYQKDFWEEESS